MKTAAIYVSTFTDKNPYLVEWRNRAERRFRRSEVSEAQNAFHRLREPGYAYLERVFKDMKPKLTPVVGMFQGVLEPSIQLVLKFRSNANWTAKASIVKRRLIDYGRIFNQSNVHMVDFAAHRPDGVTHGLRDPRAPDVVYQNSIKIDLRIDPNPLENYLLLKSCARQAGLGGLTMDAALGQVLIYTVSHDDRTKFDQRCAQFCNVLRAAGIFVAANRKEGIALTSYGDKKFDATHTYKSAEAYLKRQK